MKRIVIHWSAGVYTPNSVDKEHYHFCVSGRGKVLSGKYKPEDNENCADGHYAAHTGGGNTGSIGVALCAMAGFKNPKNVGNYPITRVQFEAACKLCAELAKQYGIKISADTIFTHYEFGLKNPKTSSAGKPDISFLPFSPELPSHKIGDLFRNKISWYFCKL